MKIFVWDRTKNEILKKERGICFEDVVACFSEGKVLAIFEHPDQEKYKDQKIAVVEINNYAYAVPYLEEKDKIILKTVYPSRKYTKVFLRKEENEMDR